MTAKQALISVLFFGSALTGCGLTVDQEYDPLPSWNDGEAKRSIIEFVDKVTTVGSPSFVPVAERIATFDNDGTLWAEQPTYVQLVFAAERVRALAPQHPEWKDREPFASVLEGDTAAVLASGEHALLDLVMATHAVRLPEINFIDDKEGKPVGIHQHVGRRPIAAFGNSDGDLQMLQWVDAGDGERLCLYVHHTDAEREWAYDRDSRIGRLDQGLHEARSKGWTVVDMTRDWKRVFSFQE